MAAVVLVLVLAHAVQSHHAPDILKHVNILTLSKDDKI